MKLPSYTSKDVYCNHAFFPIHFSVLTPDLCCSNEHTGVYSYHCNFTIQQTQGIAMLEGTSWHSRHSHVLFQDSQQEPNQQYMFQIKHIHNQLCTLFPYLQHHRNHTTTRNNSTSTGTTTYFTSLSGFEIVGLSITPPSLRILVGHRAATRAGPREANHTKQTNTLIPISLSYLSFPPIPP